MPFLDDPRADIPDAVVDDRSDTDFDRPRLRGKGKEWIVLQSFETLEEYQANVPSLDEYLSRNKVRTLTNGLICNYQCKVKNCNYFLRCIESRLLFEYSGEHVHDEGEELYHKRGLSKEQKSLIDRCLSMNIRGGKLIATEFIAYNDDLIKRGNPPLQIPNYRQIYHYVDHSLNKENGRTADLTLGKLKGYIEGNFPNTSDDDKAFCLYQSYKPENLSFQVVRLFDDAISLICC